MYRDDVCAVCGASLPPDHLYCREHAAVVDELLHEVGDRLPRLHDDLARLSELLDAIAPETWDFLAEDHPEDPVWPPLLRISLAVDGADLEVEDADEPGMVNVTIRQGLAATLRALAAALDQAGIADMAKAATAAEDAGATH